MKVFKENSENRMKVKKLERKIKDLESKINQSTFLGSLGLT